MTVTSTALNVGYGAKRCIDSVARQTFQAWHHYFIDAASTDSTLNTAISASVSGRTLVRSNAVRKAALENVWEIWQTLPDDEVIVWLDGDDWLAHDHALKVVADAYNHPSEPWLTYGQFMFANGEIGFASKYSEDPRIDTTWRATHLKTFRAGLVKKIDPRHLKTPSGEWNPYAIDRAVMFPLMEMAGLDRTCFIPNILYVYNAEASHWANETDEAEKSRVWNETFRIHRLPTYSRLENRPW